MEAQEKLATEFKILSKESENIKKRARENYLEQVSDISEKIKHFGDEAGVKAKQVIDNVGEYITKNPQKATLIGIGIGVGVGVLVGLLARRKE
ncbi:MAG: DUF883 family protein [Leptospiraceae bacterium]|jgi:ElaB protein|nr:DUF883 family protein [Leptospiraceae bacterium]MBK7054837.1 DUF883 family protein [Leptospiraceae bacterium]MBK9502788.1 DUF883 family protein [Leptospiraceae bacterium]MBP9165053.1 DUF883 family protein [Leptospiraceae bacterium]HRG46518.1 hypothetical protein [Leptospiraceae bacterium]